MARPFVFPDPNDRSPNDPSVIVSPAQVLGIYKQYTGERMERVTDKVQNWFCDKAKAYGWDVTRFSGNQCFLEVDLPKREIPEE